ncbi:MAG: YwiC-like family protein, partial [Candidatus Latescibacterota bacterium]
MSIPECIFSTYPNATLPTQISHNFMTPKKCNFFIDISDINSVFYKKRQSLAPTQITRPPIPQEHGAWFMLYVPLITMLIGLQAPLEPACLLILTVTGAFLGQHTTILFFRNRAPNGAGLWLTLYA